MTTYQQFSICFYLENYKNNGAVLAYGEIKLKLKEIDIVYDITKEEFKKNYLDKKIPVILKKFSKNWAAITNWSYEYFKQTYGHIEVPLFAEAFANSGKSYLDTQTKMLFSDYLNLIAQKTDKTQNVSIQYFLNMLLNSVMIFLILI